MNLKETYNKIAEDWYREISASHWWEPGLKIFVSLLKPNDHILDVGCGPGITAKTFTENNFRVTGIDFSEKMIEIARREVPSGHFLVMDVADINNLDGAFNGVYLQNVLLHIPKKEAKEKLANIVKKVKPGGYLYLSVKEKNPNGPEEAMKVDDDYGYKIERFFSYFTQEEIKQYFREMDIEPVYFTIVQAGKTHWIQAIGKK